MTERWRRVARSPSLPAHRQRARPRRVAPLSPRHQSTAAPAAALTCLLPLSLRQCLKYQTDQASDVKRLDKLNNVFLTRMCGKDPSEEAVEGAPAPSTLPPFAASAATGCIDA